MAEQPAAGVVQDAGAGLAHPVGQLCGHVDLALRVRFEIEQPRRGELQAAEEPGAPVAVPDEVAVAAGQVVVTRVGGARGSAETGPVQRQSFQSGRVGHRRGNVDRGGQPPALGAGAASAGQAQQQRDVHGAGIHPAGRLADDPFRVVGEVGAVVAEEQHQRPLAHSQPLDGVQQQAAPMIHHGDEAGVVGAHARQLGLQFRYLRQRPVGQGEPDRLALGAAAVPVVVVQRRLPGFVRGEAVDVQVERLAAARVLLQELLRPAEGARGGPLLLRRLRAHVDEVAARGSRPVARQQRGVGRGLGSEPIFGLAAYELPLVEAAGEVHPRHEVVRDVGDEAGVIAGCGEGLGDGRLRGRQGLPAGQVDVVPGHRPVVGERVHAPPPVHGAPRRNGRQRLRVGAGKADRLRRQPVEIRGVHGGVAVAAEVGRAQRVRGDHYDVRAFQFAHGHSIAAAARYGNRSARRPRWAKRCLYG